MMGSGAKELKADLPFVSMAIWTLKKQQMVDGGHGRFLSLWGSYCCSGNTLQPTPMTTQLKGRGDTSHLKMKVIQVSAYCAT